MIGRVWLSSLSTRPAGTRAPGKTASWKNRRDARKTRSRRPHAARPRQFARRTSIVWCSACDSNSAEARSKRVSWSRCAREGAPRFVRGGHRVGFVLVSADPRRRYRGEHQEGEGLAELAAACVRTFARPGGLSNDWIGTTAARCRESLAASVESLSRARSAAVGQLGDELVTLEIRKAIDHLGRILGTVYTEDILDRIFSRFCIGK